MFVYTGLVTMTASAVNGNEAGAGAAWGEGGGIFVWSEGGIRIDISGGTISNNRADGGGGLYFAGATANLSSGTLFNCLVTGNTAAAIGGINVRWNGHLDILYSTITGNTGTSYTGGLYLMEGGTATLHHSTVAGNSGPGSTNIFGTVDGASSYNVVGANGAGGITNGVNGNTVM